MATYEPSILFTFHYVSISTCYPRMCFRKVFIYIPLCIYFNVFGSGKTLSAVKIYIPLCIYFNDTHQAYLTISNDIYIPLCIYFNVKNIYFIREYDKFTFHYVSISTLQIQSFLRELLHLHSTMYLFQPKMP